MNADERSAMLAEIAKLKATVREYQQVTEGFVAEPKDVEPCHLRHLLETQRRHAEDMRNRIADVVGQLDLWESYKAEVFDMTAVVQNKHGEWLSHFIIQTCTDHCEKHGTDFLKTFGWEDPNVRQADLVLTINGVQVEVLDFLRVFEREGERMIKEEALQLLKEKCADMMAATWAKD